MQGTGASAHGPLLRFWYLSRQSYELLTMKELFFSLVAQRPTVKFGTARLSRSLGQTPCDRYDLRPALSIPISSSGCTG